MDFPWINNAPDKKQREKELEMPVGIFISTQKLLFYLTNVNLGEFIERVYF